MVKAVRRGQSLRDVAEHFTSVSRVLNIELSEPKANGLIVSTGRIGLTGRHCLSIGVRLRLKRVSLNFVKTSRKAVLLASIPSRNGTTRMSSTAIASVDQSDFETARRTGWTTSKTLFVATVGLVFEAACQRNRRTGSVCPT